MSKIEVKTPFGTLFAELSSDSDYPGIYIGIEQENAIDGKFERQLALVECTPDIPNVGNHTMRSLVWRKDKSEDYSDAICFQDICKRD